MQKQSLTIPFSLSKELIEEHQQRLFALGLELEELGQRQKLSSWQLRRRRNRVENMQRRLNELSDMATYGDDRNRGGHSESVLLPALGECSGGEQLVCVDYLKDLQSFQKEILTKARRVHGWINAAIRGGGLGVATTMHLSGLRSHLGKVESDLLVLEKEKQDVDKFVADVARQGRTIAEGRLFGVVLLRDFFDELQRSSRRILKRRFKVRREQSQLGRKRRWLYLQERQMASYFPTWRPPALAEILRTLETWRKKMNITDTGGKSKTPKRRASKRKLRLTGKK